MNEIINPFRNFQTGNVVVTQYIHGDIINTENFAEFCDKCLKRHQTNDWGDMEEEDKQSNDDALINGGRIFSGYKIPKNMVANGLKIWIITEHDRSTTTILYPSEY